MDYTPRYPQPFTLAQAIQLDVPMITEEIARLQNSLEHLRSTQAELSEALSIFPDDADFTKAHEENEVVIGSQAERISILEMALVEKGIPTSAHYDLAPATAAARMPASSLNRTPRPQSQTATTPNASRAPAAAEDDDGGIDL